MIRKIRLAVVAGAALVVAIPTSIVIDKWSLDRWSRNVLTQYASLQTAVDRDMPTEFLVRPDSINLYRNGDVSLIFFPPRAAWLTWCLDLVSYESYVIEIHAPKSGGRPRLHLAHGSD